MAPGDVLRVRVFEPYEGSIFPTIQRPGADLGNQRVTDDGTINVPYAGTVNVVRLTRGGEVVIAQVALDIAREVAPRYVPE